MNDQLHEAVCQAVNILNTSPDLCLTAPGRQVRSILREALANYEMEQPDTEDRRSTLQQSDAKDAARWRHTKRCVRTDNAGGYVVHPDDFVPWESSSALAFEGEVDAAIHSR